MIWGEKVKNMGKGMKKLLAVVLVLIIIGGATYYILKAKGYETGVATLSDVLNSKSVRKIENMPVIVSDKSPYYTLIGTPVALYYDGTTQKASPLLVVNPADSSRGVIRFINQYNTPSVVTIGDVPSTLSSDEREWETPTSVALSITKSFEGSAKSVSLNVAKYFWKSSDGVILVKNDQDGYNQAVVAVTLASYVNIPVIVTDTVDENVAKTLEGLGVKYSIVCGDMKGYKLTKHFGSVDEIQDWTISVIRQRLKTNVSYISMANPLDTYNLGVLDTKTVIDVKDETIVNSKASGYPGAPPTELTGPMYYFDIPYKYANIKIDLTMDISKERSGDDSGARIYAFLGVDTDGDGTLDETKDKIQFFGGSPGYEIDGLNGNPVGGIYGIDSTDGIPKSNTAHFYTEIPIFNDIGNHSIQLLASLPSSPGGSPLNPDDGESTYTLKVVVEKLKTYIYPRMYNFSSLAGYLAAYRTGVVHAKPEFMLYTDNFVKQKDCSNPAANKDLIESTNKRVGEVKKELNNLLGRIAGMPTETDNDITELANYYQSLNDNEQYTYLGIIADPSMIPQYHYPSKGIGQDPLDGYGVASDNIYSDINGDIDNPPYGLKESEPKLELAEGRIVGFNVQDVSALLCRTFFYSDIIDNIGVSEELNQPNRLSQSWKDNGFGNIGTEPPVGSAATVREKLGWMWQAAGFYVDTETRNRQFAGKQDAAQLYESSNFIYICAHGFYYWYVPTASRSYSKMFDFEGGGAFDVAHVKLMNFGPSVAMIESCVTGRIDGLYSYNLLSNAFLHSGMNTYIGATRLSWGALFPIPDAESGEGLGALMSIYFYGHLTGYVYDKSDDMTDYQPSNLSVGAAFMLARNEFMESEGTDGGGVNDDTYEEFLLHGDPAFNPYETNHEGTKTN